MASPMASGNGGRTMGEVSWLRGRVLALTAAAVAIGLTANAAPAAAAEPGTAGAPGGGHGRVAVGRGPAGHPG